MLKIFLSLLLISNVQAIDYETVDLYPDSILWVYNETCIETSNWLYLHINNTKLDLLEFDKYDNRDIEVHEIKQLGNKSVLADIFIEHPSYPYARIEQFKITEDEDMEDSTVLISVTYNKNFIGCQQIEIPLESLPSSFAENPENTLFYPYNYNESFCEFEFYTFKRPKGDMGRIEEEEEEDYLNASWYKEYEEAKEDLALRNYQSEELRDYRIKLNVSNQSNDICFCTEPKFSDDKPFLDVLASKYTVLSIINDTVEILREGNEDDLYQVNINEFVDNFKFKPYKNMTWYQTCSLDFALIENREAIKEDMIFNASKPLWVEVIKEDNPLVYIKITEA